MRILSVIGTRPEVIKMAPVVAELSHQTRIESRVLTTAQHREMLDQALDLFGIKPDYDLDLMQPNQSAAQVLAGVLSGMQPVLGEFGPDWVLVQGDTTTALAAALAAAYAGCRVGHVEAGLRTYDRRSPFPEELNRVLVDHLSALCFAPTERARLALLREGISADTIYVTGNPVVDALHFISSQTASGICISVPDGKRLILVTAHRRENHGRPLQSILAAIRQLATRPDLHVIYPVHRNPSVWKPVHAALGGVARVTLTEPLDYHSFVRLMNQAYLILTDSGGIQEEAPSLGVPVLVMRSVTERPEAVEAGVVRLVGTDPEVIVRETARLLDVPAAYAAMVTAQNPFGDGKAARRIVNILSTGSVGSDAFHDS